MDVTTYVKWRDRGTDRQTGRHEGHFRLTDRPTDTQTDRQTHCAYQLVLLTAIAMELNNRLILLSESTASLLSTGVNTTKWRNPYLWMLNKFGHQSHSTLWTFHFANHLLIIWSTTFRLGGHERHHYLRWCSKESNQNGERNERLHYYYYWFIASLSSQKAELLSDKYNL